MRSIIASALALCLVFGQAIAQPGLRGQLETPALEYAPGQVLVKFREGITPAQRAWARHITGAQLIRRGDYLDYELWQFSPYADMRAVAAQLRQSGWFEAAEPNWRIYLADGWTPNDTLYPQQPALPFIRAPQAWALRRGDDNFVMAILDTGVRLDHLDLQPRLLPGYDFGGDANGVRDNIPSDFHGHGTFVAGIAGAVTNNNRGVASVAPNGKILPVKVFRDGGQGWLNDILDGIAYTAVQGAHAMNLSLGNRAYASGWDLVRDALNAAWNSGVVVVAAAGNENNTNPFYPAWYPVCIAVAACNLDGTRSSVSTYGSWVDVAAPSGDVYSTTMSGVDTYGRNTGGFTSYAAPFVTAQAALLYSLVADGPSDRSVARAQAVRELIETTARPANYVAWGIIDLQASVEKALTVPVRGRVQIQNYIGSYNGRTVEVVLRPRGGGNAIATQSGTLNAAGDFSVSFFNYLGYYDLAIRAQGTLLKRVPNARMRYPGVSGLNLTLIPGDVNGDNRIDDADLLQVLFHFGANNPSIDLNGDGRVDDADLLIVLFNFGAVGD
ncbi:MAG: S8 family serine peptidase [Fimbriimonadales bacterium]|nr:S8 family serine peptidase [Fimbriimonadales bacterium]